MQVEQIESPGRSPGLHDCRAGLHYTESEPIVANPKDISTLYQEVTRAAAFGLLVNLLLGTVKLIGGIIGNSFALIADAVNSIGDVVTTIAVLFALRVAQRPADAEHPYGHTRAEGIAATNVALLVIISALLVGWEAIQRITVPHAIPPVWTLWIAGANMLIKEGLYQYKIRVGKRTGSAAIIANAWDHRSDAFCSLAVLIGLGAVRFGRESLFWADDVASLVVVAAIVWTGVQLFRSSANELMDAQADPEFVKQIERIALNTPGVEEVETLWCESQAWNSSLTFISKSISIFPLQKDTESDMRSRIDLWPGFRTCEMFSCTLSHFRTLTCKVMMLMTAEEIVAGQF